MRSIQRTLRRPSLIPKSKRNCAVLSQTRFKTLWRCQIHINLKIDAGVAFVSDVQYVVSIRDSEGSMLVSAHASTIYAVGRIKSKTKQILPTVTTESRISITNTFHKFLEKRNPYQSKNWRRRRLYPPYNVSYEPKTVKALCWKACIRLRYVQCEE
jgi:hypothetical protein